MAEPTMISEADILKDVIGSDQGDLSPEVAEAILRWRFADRAVERMTDLADRNNKGLLSEVEEDELERYLRVGGLVNLLQAKARLSLKRSQRTG
jgi:hypothetical protein